MLDISSSSLQQFGQCRKAYELGYEMLLEPNIRSEAMDNGSSFHQMIEAYWKWTRWNMGGRLGPEVPRPTVDDSDQMAAVFTEYLLNQVINEGGHLSQIKRIILVEEPFYIEVIPGVNLRYTPDLVWEDYN
ncbi:MAG: PD-(D/E)XK nuclease family protein, partial [Aliidongia sp.]